MKFKKIVMMLAVVLTAAVIMTAGSIPVQALTGDNFRMEDGVLTVTGEKFCIVSTSLKDFREDVKKVVVQPGVTELGSMAFQNCSNLTQVTLPASLKYISDDAFSGCSSLGSIKLPSGITKIETYAFFNCSSLKSIEIPKNVTVIEAHAFDGCTSLAGTLTIPEGVTEFGYGAFYGCTSIQKVVLPSTLKTMGGISWGTFADCKSLEEINIPINVDTITDFDFEGCSSLKKISLINGTLKRIGSEAFKNCTSLESLIIPSSVTGLGNQCFVGCTAMKDLAILGSNVSVNTYADETSLASATVHCMQYSGAEAAAKGWGCAIHHLKEGVITRKPTATAYGERKYVCKDCGKTYTEVLPPQDLPVISSLTSTSKGVKIQWSAVNGATSYQIYRNGQKISSTSSTSYVDTKAKKNGSFYNYKIVAQKGSSGTTVIGESEQKQTLYLTAQKITSLKNKAKKKAVVKYKKNSKATGYQIQYGTSSKFTKTKTKTVTAKKKKTSVTLKKLKKGKKYYVRVRAYKSYGAVTYYGAWSSKKSVKIKK